MPTLRLSPKMVVSLERLYETTGQTEYVPYSTAYALEARELVSLGGGQRTGKGAFPEYRVTLTNAGRGWCERHFAKLRSRENIDIVP